MKNQTGNTLIILAVIVLIVLIAVTAYYFGTKNPQTPQPEPAIPQQQSPEPEIDVSVKIEAGDVVITKNGENKKITDWGYNSAPTLSPDKTKVAYTSKTEESFENEKTMRGYVPGSTNVWIINIDGTNPVRVTNHANWIYRDNLIWLDDDRLLFTDGTSSVKVFNLKDSTLENILGPETPDGVCVDACGGESRFLLSPDKRYLVLLYSGSGGIFMPLENQILNTETLIAEKMNQKFSSLEYVTAEFKDDSLFITGTDESDAGQKTFNINLLTGEVSHL